MRSFLTASVGAVLSAIFATGASASTYTFSGTVGGQTVSATATVTEVGGITEIQVTNNEADPTSVAQAISQIFVSFASTPGTPSFDSTQPLETVANITGTGTFTTSSLATDWTLSKSGNTVELNDLGSANPDQTIIGGPGSGGTYDNAKGSIAGNGPHNPFTYVTGTWYLDLALPNSAVTGVTLNFNTSANNDIVGVLTTPIPGTFWLFAAGLLFLGWKGWRGSRDNACATASAV